MTTPPMDEAGQSQGVRYVELPPQRNAGAVVVAFLLIPALLLAGVGVLVHSCVDRVTKPLSSLAEEVASASDKGAKNRPARQGVGSVAPKLVDAAEVLETAIVEARKEYPDAVMVSAHFKEVRGGLVDVNASNAAHVMFEYRRVDSSKPAGKDVDEGSFHIAVREGGYAVWAHHSGRGMASALGGGLTATPTPKCRAAAAWKTASESGVPADAVASLHFDRDRPFRADASVTEWSFRVDGHDEYRREIDATTCALRRAWDAKGSPVRNAPSQRPGTSNGAPQVPTNPAPRSPSRPDNAGF